jgi:hypothetical protein
MQASPTALPLKIRKRVCLTKFCHNKMYKWSFYIYFSIGMSVIFGVINTFKLYSFVFIMYVQYLICVFHWYGCHFLCHGPN